MPSGRLTQGHMKSPMTRLLALILVMIALPLTASATIPFASAHGYGLQTQNSYHENAPIAGGLSAPVTSWSQWPGAWDWNYTITADTDYAVGLYDVGYQDAPYYEVVQVYIY